jgi:hypothetical protein
MTYELLFQEFEETPDVEATLIKNSNKVVMFTNKIKKEDEVQYD